MADTTIPYQKGGVLFDAAGVVAVQVPDPNLGSLEITVLDAAKNKVALAQVDLSGPLALGDGTSAGGSARFAGLPAGTYQVDVVHPILGKSSAQIDVPAAKANAKSAVVADSGGGGGGAGTTLVVNLSPTLGNLVVTVVDADGEAVPKASVRAAGNSQRNQTTAAADATGKAQLPNLAPGDYEVFADASGLVFSSVKGVKVAAGNNTLTITAGAPPDLPIDPRTALLFSPQAPQAFGTTAPADDRRAVWAHVPGGIPLAPPDVYVYFHGFNNFVTVKAGGTPGGVTRIPGWIRADRTGEAGGTVASGVKYKLASVYTGSKQKPLVLVPEVGTADPLTAAEVAQIQKDNAAELARFKKEKEEWEARGKADPKPKPAKTKAVFYSRTGAGNLAPGGNADQLALLLQDCFDRLVRLKNAGAPYLSAAVDLEKTRPRRLYLSGHSGGGVPLTGTATSSLAKLLPTDLWVLDATYGTGRSEYVAFCNDKAKKGELGTGAGKSRFVAISMKHNDSGTENNLNQIVADLTSAGAAPDLVAAKIAPLVTTYDSAVDDARLRKQLANPIVIIKTSVSHDEIPARFLPLLFETAS